MIRVVKESNNNIHHVSDEGTGNTSPHGLPSFYEL
jgi:hypothetical protein